MRSGLRVVGAGASSAPRPSLAVLPVLTGGVTAATEQATYGLAGGLETFPGRGAAGLHSLAGGLRRARGGTAHVGIVRRVRRAACREQDHEEQVACRGHRAKSSRHESGGCRSGAESARTPHASSAGEGRAFQGPALTGMLAMKGDRDGERPGMVNDMRVLGLGWVGFVIAGLVVAGCGNHNAASKDAGNGGGGGDSGALTDANGADSPTVDGGNEASKPEAGTDASKPEAGTDASKPDAKAEGGQGTPRVLSQAWQYWGPSGSPWWALQNPWGGEPSGYTQTLTCYTGSFPAGTLISWDYGSNVASGNVWGYPEVIYGRQAGWWANPNSGGVTPTPVQLGNLSSFTFSWNVTLSGNLQQYDVLAETHFATVANPGSSNQTPLEFGVFLWNPNFANSYFDSKTIYNYNSGGFQAKISPNVWAAGTFAMLPTSVEAGTPWTSGTINFLPIIQWGISKGLLPSGSYLTGFELGIEMQQGSGSMTVNNISCKWQ